MNYGSAFRDPCRPALNPDFIRSLWRLGMDTNDIARQMTCSEAEVYNTLASMRERAA